MDPQQFAYESMGSHWRVSVWDRISPSELADLEREVTAASAAFDETYSRFKRTSLVWKLAESAGPQEVPGDLTAMLSLYQKLHVPSNGKLNPLVGFTISDLGYDDQYTLVPKASIRQTPAFSTLHVIDRTHVELGEPALLDLGALGKGFFVDRIGALLRERGVAHFLVDGSGDVLHSGPSPITAGLEHPDDPAQVVGTALLGNGALCASGTNRRRWGDLHHVVDPTTSSPARGILATWALAESAALADGLASCLFFADPEKLRTQFSFEYCVLYEDRTAALSPGFPGKLF